MNNLRKTRREFSQFLFLAKASGAELQSHLYVALNHWPLTNILINWQEREG